jgi:hypothetical protein
MTRGQAVTTIHLACLAIGLPATALGQLSEERGLLIVCQALLVLTIVALLERAGRNRAMSRSQNTPASSESTRLQEPAPLAKAYETEDVHKER